MTSTPIATTKTAALARILDTVPKGYFRYTHGTIKSEKALALAKKFHVAYGIACTPAQRITRKKQGLANTLLVMFWAPEAKTVEWLLLATDGAGLKAESLKDVRQRNRLIWLGYEFVRHTPRDKPSWTWRRPKLEMKEQYELLRELMHGRRFKQVGEVLECLAHQPGFHGVREQTWSLIQFVRKMGYDGETPHLYFVQKVSHGERVVVA